MFFNTSSTKRVDNSCKNQEIDIKSDLNLEDSKTWSTTELKMLLSLRKKSATGSYETLSASYTKFQFFQTKFISLYIDPDPH